MNLKNLISYFQSKILMLYLKQNLIQVKSFNWKEIYPWNLSIQIEK